MAAAVRQQDSRLADIYKPIVRYLQPLRDQITARKKHLAKADFEKSILRSPEVAQTYTTSAMKMSQASLISATNIRVLASEISRKLKAKNLDKLARMTEKIATDLFQVVQKEVLLWGTFYDVINQLRSKDKKTAESAAVIIPMLFEKLEQNFDAELTLIDQLTLMTRGGGRAA